MSANPSLHHMEPSPSNPNNISADLIKRWRSQFEETQKLGEQLLQTAKGRISELDSLLTELSGHWHAEDSFYRFYHQSFKVYGLRADTERIVTTLRSLLPERELNQWFLEIVREGTGKQFDPTHNQHWLRETRPILEAFFHARSMLEYVIKYARELETAPQLLPSGWAAVLYLYNIR